MILDKSLQFDPPGTAVTVTADSTNILDLINNRDMGPGKQEVVVVSFCEATFTSSTASATLNIQLLGAPDSGTGTEGTYNLIGETGAMKLGQLQTGNKIAQFVVPPVADSSVPTATPLLTTTATSTSATVSSATGIMQGQFIVSAGVVPGTTVSNISGTTVTLSTAAASTTAAVASAFDAYPGPYRFLKLSYVCSATMTAGKVESYLGPQAIDTVTFYRPGVTVAN